MDKENEQRTERLKARAEAILFSHGEPLEIKKIAALLELTSSAVRDLLQRMAADYASVGRGIELVQMGDAVQLSTKKEHFEDISSLHAKSRTKGLSSSALEVLAIIAYRQPITKAQIESIRGTNSDATVSMLAAKNLVEPVGKLDKPGRPEQFATTHQFLKLFGLQTVDELPPFEELPLLTLTGEYD